MQSNYSSMKTFHLTIGLIFITAFSIAQSVSDKLEIAMKKLEADSSLRHASLSLYVVESKTNKVVFDFNSQLGLAPASCQKIITSVTAFELLGNNYQYKTELGYDGIITDGVLKGNLYIIGYGDPTLGSWRFSNTKDSVVLANWMHAIKRSSIKTIDGNIFFDGRKFTHQPLPGGWVWDDIGNYYGAGTWGLNWYENQYDLMLQPGENEGDEVTILTTKPKLQKAFLKPNIKTGKKGSGDNGYIYLPPYSTTGFVEGTVPADEKVFTISGALPNPVWQIENALKGKLISEKITFKSMIDIAMLDENNQTNKATTIINTHLSPMLDSINYWFLRKSINLYGEALLKTISVENTSAGGTDKGVTAIKNFSSNKCFYS